MSKLLGYTFIILLGNGMLNLHLKYEFGILFIKVLDTWPGPVVGPYLHIVVVVTIYPLAHR